VSTGWPAWAEGRDTRDGRAWPVDPDPDPWPGPAWAAPERVERWACRPSPFPLLGPEDLAVVMALNSGQITAEQFQEAWRVGHL
jgi:hypothetical protein